MHTKDFLAQELRKAGLEEMAKKADTGYYHDYLSPLATPEMQLMIDLNKEMVRENNPDKYAAINALRSRHLNGEFDANLQESDDWAASADGQAAFNSLVKGK
jgi:hypothetical protein